MAGAFRRRSPRSGAELSKQMGWDPREPGALVVALFLVLIAGGLSWWGFVTDTSDPGYTTGTGTDFGIWGAEQWYLAILAGAVYRDAEALTWWDFVRAHPEFQAYGTVAPILSALWTASLLAGGIALRFRFKPRSRMRGWPTALQGVAVGLVAAGIAVAAVGLPIAAGLSFAGAGGRLTWGPGLGWFAATAAGGFLSLSTVLGWRSDRSVRGLCWKCYREVGVRVCEYCGATQ